MGTTATAITDSGTRAVRLMYTKTLRNLRLSCTSADSSDELGQRALLE